MTSVWYVGPSNRRVIQSSDWVQAGVTDAAGTFTWDPSNGYSYPSTAFSLQQLAWLDSQFEDFWATAPDGPRTAVVLPPDQFVTLNKIREMFSTGDFGILNGLTKATVGLGNVDNTSDAAKPVSAAQQLALDGKADRPPGGTDGQYLVRNGLTTVWFSPPGGGSVAVTQVPDADMPSGYRYSVTGTGVAPVADADMPSGSRYSIN